jgi:hypothetical protein
MDHILTHKPGNEIMKSVKTYSKNHVYQGKLQKKMVNVGWVCPEKK